MRIGKEIEITHDLSNGLYNQFSKLIIESIRAY